MADETDPRIDKRRVTMRNYVTRPDINGDPITEVQEAVDYVRPDILDAYLAYQHDRWSFVEVSDEPDAGPGGYHGATYVPEALDHPLAGEFFPATDEEN